MELSWIGLGLIASGVLVLIADMAWSALNPLAKAGDIPVADAVKELGKDL